MVEMDKDSFYVTSASSRDRRSSRLSRSRPAHRQAFLQRQLSICSHEPHVAGEYLECGY